MGDITNPSVYIWLVKIKTIIPTLKDIILVVAGSCNVMDINIDSIDIHHFSESLEIFIMEIFEMNIIFP